MPFYKGCLSLLWAKREIRYRDPSEDQLLQEMRPQGIYPRTHDLADEGKAPPLNATYAAEA